MFAEAITPTEVAVLDKKIYEANAAFLAVPAFKRLFKPKHHFTSHVAVNISRMGPMREYWCYSYEGFHQRVKHICKNSSFKNVSKRVMRFWSMQFALCMGCRDARERTRLSNLA
jgi:hypothetical protein